MSAKGDSERIRAFLCRGHLTGPVVIDVPALLARKDAPMTGGRPGRRRWRSRREDSRCAWCGRVFGRKHMTTDHLIPKCLGGPTVPQNEVNACKACNSHRGHVLPIAHLDDCLARGLDARPDAVIGALLRFDRRLLGKPGQTRLKKLVSREIYKAMLSPAYRFVGPLAGRKRLCDGKPVLMSVSGVLEAAPRPSRQAPGWPSPAPAPAALAIPA